MFFPHWKEHFFDMYSRIERNLTATVKNIEKIPKNVDEIDNGC